MSKAGRPVTTQPAERVGELQEFDLYIEQLKQTMILIQPNYKIIIPQTYAKTFSTFKTILNNALDATIVYLTNTRNMYNMYLYDGMVESINRLKTTDIAIPTILIQLRNNINEWLSTTQELDEFDKAMQDLEQKYTITNSDPYTDPMELVRNAENAYEQAIPKTPLISPRDEQSGYQPIGSVSPSPLTPSNFQPIQTISPQQVLQVRNNYQAISRDIPNVEEILRKISGNVQELTISSRLNFNQVNDIMMNMRKEIEMMKEAEIKKQVMSGVVVPLSVNGISLQQQQALDMINRGANIYKIPKDKMEEGYIQLGKDVYMKSITPIRLTGTVEKEVKFLNKIQPAKIVFNTKYGKYVVEQGGNQLYIAQSLQEAEKFAINGGWESDKLKIIRKMRQDAEKIIKNPKLKLNVLVRR